MKFDVKITRSETETVINISADVFNDINETIMVHFSLIQKVDIKLNHVINGTGSVCNLVSRFKSHPIVKFVGKEMMKGSKLPTSCPIKKVCV